MCEFTEEGAFGLIINKSSPIPLQIILDALETDLTVEDTLMCGLGGPVQREACLIIHGAPPNQNDTWHVSEGISVSGQKERLKECIRDKHPYRAVLGYAGWAPEQLVAEIERGDWLYTDATPELVFKTPMNVIYDVALAEIGLTAELFTNSTVNNSSIESRN